jgi:hypothetical protein
MAILKHIRTSITAILLTTAVMITISINIPSVLALRDCGSCGAFLKLTAQFEKAVIGAVSPPEPEKIGQFRQLTGQWKSDVINVVLRNPPEPEKIPRSHSVYADKVLAIFLGGPDTIPGLLDAYSQGVKEIFGLGPGTTPLPVITINPTSGFALTIVTVTGTGFAPTSTVTINFDGYPYPLATTPNTIITNNDGEFSATFLVPGSTGADHAVTATQGSNSVSKTFTVIVQPHDE